MKKNNLLLLFMYLNTQNYLYYLVQTFILKNTSINATSLILLHQADSLDDTSLLQNKTY